MTYTDEQWKILEQAATGFEWYFFKDEAADRTVRYLQDKKLIDAKGNGTPAKYILTEKGEQVLAERAAKQQAEDQRRKEKRQEEAVRLKEREEDIAREEKQNKIQNRFSCLNLLLSFASFAAGVFVEYRIQLVELLENLAVLIFG